MPGTKDANADSVRAARETRWPAQRLLLLAVALVAGEGAVRVASLPAEVAALDHRVAVEAQCEGAVASAYSCFRLIFARMSQACPGNMPLGQALFSPFALSRYLTECVVVSVQMKMSATDHLLLTSPSVLR